jgi:hypothetical protein
MHYPLRLTFKFSGHSPQIIVTDVEGNLVFYIKQKLFKVKESITVFADTEQTLPLYLIQADQNIGASAQYRFIEINGISMGSLHRQQMRSRWKSHYDILNQSHTPIMTIREKNFWVKFLDGLLCDMPVIGLLSGYVFNPTFFITRSPDRIVMHLEKTPSFVSRLYTIKQVDELEEQEEKIALLSLLMMLLLERQRN